MEFIQLDLFDIADQNESDSVFSSNPNTVDDLRLGDIIHVKWSNGVEWEGVYTGLKGFWDNRPEFRHWDWIYSTKVWHKGKPDETRQYTHVDLHREEWFYVGRDEAYRLPIKEDYASMLAERLAKVPFQKRMTEFQRFESEVPYLSYEHHSWVSHAWEIAICNVTTLDEFLAAEKDWTCKLTLPQKAVKHIATVAFNTEPTERLDVIKRMRWVLNTYSEKTYIEMPEQREITVYRDLYKKFIVEARTPEELVTVVRMRGGQTRYIDGKAPGKFWVEGLETELEVSA